MAPRKKRASRQSVRVLSAPHVRLAKLIIFVEQIAAIFAPPLAIAAFFIILGLFDVLTWLYPWGHLGALAVFIMSLAYTFGKARRLWRKPGQGAALRRVEAASGLSHRPLDVLTDRPFSGGRLTTEAEQGLWQAHVANAQRQLSHLHWPKMKIDTSRVDPYGVRYFLLVLLIIGLVVGWGAIGGRLIAAINPALERHLALFNPTLDAWITPPDYTGLPPIMISTPAGLRHNTNAIDIPEGSEISAHLMEQDGDVPALVTDNAKTAFTSDTHGDFAVTAPVGVTAKLSIRRGWHMLASWRVHVVADAPPQIAFTDPPSVSERKTVRLSYQATDDYGVTDVSVRIVPRESLVGTDNDPVELPLASPMAKSVTRTSFQDLASHPWAGAPVRLTLVATDAAGHRSESAPVDFTLPEREFFNPVARILIGERKKLALVNDNGPQRNDIANVMAGIAHETDSYNGDPLVMLALRAGAVRLVLDHTHDAVNDAGDILWKTAVRVEDGTTGGAERNMRQAQKDLADALDRNAGQQEIQQLINRLRQALAQYLSELATRMASRPNTPMAISPPGVQTNMLTPRDLDRMLENMRGLSAAGAKDAARQELAKLQQFLENINTNPQPAQLSDAQKQMVQQLQAIYGLQQQQQQLLDKTYRSRDMPQAGANQLAQQQNELRQQLQHVIDSLLPDSGRTGKAGAPDQSGPGQPAQSLAHSAGAMGNAASQLQHGNTHSAVPNQSAAIQGLQQAIQSLAQQLSSTMAPGQGGRGVPGADPFGRQSDVTNDSTVKVPDHMQVQRVREILNELQQRSGDRERSKTERDYIDRLLQDF